MGRGRWGGVRVGAVMWGGVGAVTWGGDGVAWHGGGLRDMGVRVGSL